MPPKKKPKKKSPKGKKDRKGKKKMSKKERREEKKRRMMEKKRAIQMEHLRREIKYGNITRRKQEKNWREFVMRIGREMMKEELEYIWQIFEWTVDLKDCTISKLMDELDKANQQNLYLQRSHAEAVGEWFQKLHDNIGDLHDQFYTSLDEMKQDFEDRNWEYMRNFREMQFDMEKSLHRVEYEHVEIWRTEVIRHIRMIEFVSGIEKDLRDGEILYGGKLNTLWNKYEIIYNKHTKDVEKIEKLAKSVAAVTIATKLKKIKHLIDLIHIFKDKLKVIHDTGSAPLNKLRETSDLFSHYLFILKNKLFEDNTMDSSRVKVLVRNAQLVLVHLESICKKGELLIRKMRVTRPLETFREKVLPFPVLEHLKKGHMQHPQMYHRVGKIHLFYQKIGAANSERTALSEERKVLILEQRKLKKKLEEVFMDIRAPKLQEVTVKRLKPIENFENTYLEEYWPQETDE